MLTGRAARVNVGRRHVVPRYVVTLVCATSAGVHAALVPDHVRESLPLGVAIAVAAVAPALVALALRRPTHGNRVPLAAIAVLLGIATAYVLSRTTGVPWLITTPEAFDPVGVVTTAAEVLGAVAAALLIRPRALLITRKDNV